MAENEKQIQIRTLYGESTTISIPSNRSIQDLKLLLVLIFIPAKTCPNFHLFFKGAKMSLGSSLSSYSIESDEFIVLVPFTKKDKSQNQVRSVSHTDRYDTLPKTSSSSSVVADSTYSDLMEDLSSLADRDRNQNSKEVLENVVSHIETPERNETWNQLLGDVFNSSKESSDLDEKGYEKIARFSDSMNCLCDSKTGKCLLLKLLGNNKEKLCQCPIWLKRLLKVFSFLNIFSGFLQMQNLAITWDSVKGAMRNLGAFGLEVGVEDVKHLSVICPKILRIGNNVSEPIKLGDVIVILDSSANARVQPGSANNIRTVRKQVSTSSIVNTVKKRELAFKTTLWWVVGISLGKRKCGNGMKKLPSLEDLLVLMKDTDTATTFGESKRARTNSSAGLTSQSGQTRCRDMKPLSPEEMVGHLRKGVGSRQQIVHVKEIGARIAIRVDIPNELSELTATALKKIGVSRLYSHQAESIQASLSGKNVVVATMTSSGKSLCYNVPVLESLSQNSMSCALYLFPTKALAQDQIRALSVMTEGMEMSFNFGVYDGDTSQENRKWLRDNARLLITNPDMLHMSILPFHTQFQRILSNLRFVVIDEAHTYKGAFGCHTALVLRRLRRLCGHVYGSDPAFIFCTATSANPREHAMELAGLSTLDLIQNDGSPSGPKFFALWNPPIYWKTVGAFSFAIIISTDGGLKYSSFYLEYLFFFLGKSQVSKASSETCTSKTADKEIISRRSSPVLELSSLFAEMVQHGLRCIAFCKTRKLCELVLLYTREILKEAAPLLVDSIGSYRAGYIAQDRRRIESELFGGKLLGVAATNALELGIDVGHVDATLHLGFPGSVSSLWQQAGRSGRREKSSLAVYVAFEGPLDQYFMKFPEKLFGRSIECCHIDAQNKQVLEQHLVCASVEHPLSLLHDERYFGPGLNSSIASLVKKRCLSSDPSHDFPDRMWSYIGIEKRPSYGVSIRAIETEKYKVIDKKTNEVIEEIEESKAFFQVYEGAVYMQQGKIYLVKDLDIYEKIAICEEAVVTYYTKTRDYTDVHLSGRDMVCSALLHLHMHSFISCDLQQMVMLPAVACYVVLE
ncbi:Atp-dependent helicase hrq1 [Thalictrum thalictroides]|uniref:Atp-dependent helicase hrq1 n=1 Tax=Thalictrum thalictroides TaxID=46969 RepID=A0A7J6UY59_THATH|nr:Atp-dependent helicase hrq1 [Thalictrum thalictroides]